MIKNLFLAALVLACAVQALHLHQVHESSASLPAGTAILVSDNGQNLRVCVECGGLKSDSASIQAVKDASAVWTLEKVGSQVTFKGSNGLYLSRCNNCWTDGLYPDSAFVNAATVGASSLWTPELQSNGKYAFKSDSGRYLARCQNCVKNTTISNFAFVHHPRPTDDFAQWDVQYTNILTTGNVTLVSDNGMNLRVCHACGGLKDDSASIENVKDQTSVWLLETVASQVAFKGSNGFYLKRCNNCWPEGMYSDSAFVSATTYETDALWTPELQKTGKYTFKSDNGKYLARCQFCTKNTTESNFAFIHESDPTKGHAQWDLKYTNMPEKGNVTLKADEGGFLKLCDGCGAENAATIEQGTGPLFQWKLLTILNKVALQAQNGKWLSVCKDCWTSSVATYSAFANSNSSSASTSQWTPVKLDNGNWAFKGDNGKYLARCHTCTSQSKVDDLAFVHASYPTEPWAQWNLTYHAYQS